ALLNESEQCVENDYRKDDPRVDPHVHHQLGEPGGEQHIDEGVVEVCEEPREQAPLPAFRQAVWPVSLEPSRGFRSVGTFLCVGHESLDDFSVRHRMPGRYVAGSVGHHCCAHARAPLGVLLRSESGEWARGLLSYQRKRMWTMG